MIRTIAVIGTLVLLLPSFMQAAADDDCWNGTITQQDGITYVHNASESNCPPVVYEMVERWRLESSADSDFVHGRISDVVQLAGGEICLLDSQLRTIHLVASDGEYLGTVGREGEGPGELRFPTSMFERSDGCLGVVDPWARKVVFLTREGVPQGAWEPLLDGYDRISVLEVLPILNGYVATVETHIWEDVAAESGILVGVFSYKGQLEEKLVSTAIRRENKRVMQYDEEKSHADLLLGVIDNRLVYCLREHHNYAFSIHDDVGKHHTNADLVYEAWPRTSEEMAYYMEYWENFYRRYDDAKVRISRFERSIYGVHSRTDQTVWIEHSRGWFDNPEGVALTFHAHDWQGRYLNAVQLRGRINAEEDAAYVLSSGVLVVRAATSSWLGSVGVSSSGSTQQEDDAIVFYELIESTH